MVKEVLRRMWSCAQCRMGKLFHKQICDCALNDTEENLTMRKKAYCEVMFCKLCTQLVPNLVENILCSQTSIFLLDMADCVKFRF